MRQKCPKSLEIEAFRYKYYVNAAKLLIKINKLI